MFFHRNDSDEQGAGDGTPGGESFPLLPLRDIIVFPHMVVPLFVGREKSINALEEAMSQHKEILLAAQKKAKTNDPTSDDIFEVGTIGTIIQLLRLPDGTVKVLVEGKRRARITHFVPNEEFFLCNVEPIEEVDAASVEIEALIRSVQSAFDVYAKLNKRIAPEMLMTVQTIDDPSKLADTVVVHLTSIKLSDRQEILETIEPAKRLERLFQLMNAEIEILQVEMKIRSRVKKQMEKTQKEYYLNEQMHAIQKELGERDEFKSEIQELEAQLKQKKLSKEAHLKARKELKKLKMMQPMSAEATVIRNYIDWVLALPWGEKSEENYDIDAAEQILEEDHYGLKKPKERIVEYLAVQALVRKLKGPVLCFVGPPGVGKTSLAKSIARCSGREFVRLSLGGVRDEAEIRGHRRTYIGALPGRLIQSLRKVGVNNPVFLLDEIDKMSADFRGDPASALLEVLDPEQNHSFNRMEILEISGYTEFEKLNIATRYLVPRQRENAGLKDIDIEISENAIRQIIHYYTMESGVRNLEREIGSVCRKIARQVLKDGEESKEKSYHVEAKDIAQYLGVPKYRPDKANEKDHVGLTNGLAVNAFGGSILECEVAVVPGKGKLNITGLLEKGMQESAQAAMSYIRSRQKVLGLEKDFHSKYDVHIHFPSFVPKDGPSAGITMATSVASALLKIPVRKNVAMTGEITLRGRIMPIGGLKEKLLAAHRAEIEVVLVPKENQKDLKEIPRRVLNALRIVLVEHMDEVLREALVLSDPDALFGEHQTRPAEYRDGELITPEAPDAEDVPEPTVDPPGARQ
ncbi:MAG: endopeptidase La [Deltaproteobacteria bacterium]|nr:endopeptidase La [Deltaproteobacteria bacterium]